MHNNMRLDIGFTQFGAVRKLVRFFIKSTAVILFGTAMAKVISSFGGAHILEGPDPVFGIPIRALFIITAVIEIGVALVCIRGRLLSLKIGLILWLSTVFVFYRVGLWVVGYDKPCPCLGNITDALHIPPQIADTAMKIILAYLLIGSYATLFWLWRQKRKAVSDTASSDTSVSSIAPKAQNLCRKASSQTIQAP
jgi:hypothetical protein